MNGGESLQASKGVAARIIERLRLVHGLNLRVVLLREPNEDTTPPIRPAGRASNAGFESDRLDVVGEIARGGMGVVMRGQDRDLGRDVAIKVLRPEFVADPIIVDRFIEEAQIGGQLQHPGIAPVYGLGLLESGQPYFTMKLARGETFAAALARRGETAEELAREIRILVRVAEALGYAHARGVIHRDVKPENVMLGAFGEVLLLDWGLARVRSRIAAGGTKSATQSIVETVRTRDSSSHSHVGSVMGTWPYMAPEQANGRVDDLDGRVDVFALGSMLTEILTGKPAYSGSAEEVRRAARAGDLGDARGRLAAASIEPDLRRLALSCLEIEPSKRPPDGTAVAQAAHRWLESLDVRLRRSTLAAARADERAQAAGRRAVAERRLHRARISCLACFGVLAAGIVGWSIWRDATIDSERAASRRRIEDALGAAASARAVATKEASAKAWFVALDAAGHAAVLARKDGRAPLIERAELVVAEATAAADRAAVEERRSETVRRIADRLDLVRSRAGDHDDVERQDRDYAAAFAEIDFRPDADDTGTVTARIAASGAAEEIVLALDAWTALRRRLDAPSARLRGLAQALDSDAMRKRVRAAEDRAAELEAIAAEPGIPAASARTLELLARNLCWAGRVRKGLVVWRAAAEAHPADFWIAHDYAWWLQHPYAPERRGRTDFGMKRTDKESRAMTRADIEESLRRYRIAQALRPESVDLGWHIAETLIRLKRYEEAVRIADELGSRYPSSLIPHELLAAVAFSQKKPAEAIPHILRGLAVDPENVDFLIGLGDAKRLTGASAEAVEAYERAGALSDRSLRLRDSFVEALLRCEDWPRRIEVLRATLEKEPRRDQLRKVISAAYFDGGATSSPLYLSLLEDGVKVAESPDYFAADLSLAYNTLGRYEESVAFCKRWLEKYPTNVYVLTNIGVALLETDRQAQALPYFLEAARLDPLYAQIHNYVGRCYAETGDQHAAIEAYRRCAALDRSDPMCRNNLGNALQKLGDFEGARRAYDESNALSPTYNSLIGSANCSLRIETGPAGVAMAAAAFAAASKLAPEDVDVRRRLAGALAELGRQGEAIDILSRTAGVGSTDREHALVDLVYTLCESGRQREGFDIVERRGDDVRDARDRQMIYQNYGIHLMKCGLANKALDVLRNDLDRSSVDTSVLACTGLALTELGRFDEARPIFENAVRLSADETERVLRVGYLRDLDRLVEAEDHLERSAAEGRAVSALDCWWLGRLLMIRGRPADGQRWFETAFAKDPRLLALVDDGYPSHAARNALRVAVLPAVADAVSSAAATALARKWLRSAMEARRDRVADDPAERTELLEALGQLELWPELERFKDEALAALPPAEATAWREFWSEIQSLRKSYDANPVTLVR